MLAILMTLKQYFPVTYTYILTDRNRNERQSGGGFWGNTKNKESGIID